MRLTTLSDNTLIVEQYMQTSKTILRESCNGLTSQQQYVVENVYNALVPLIEAALTADQVKQIFTQVEKQSIEGGKSRSVVGNAVDAAKEANKIIDKLGAKLQDTAPVKAFDQKFENLKAKIANKFPELAEQTAALGEWVKANPGKSAAVIGVLTALASLAAGPVGGAVAGQVLKGAQELLKGERLSTAVGKGLKAAAVGWLAGKSMEAVGKMISGAYEHFNPVPLTQNNSFSEINIGNGLPSTFQNAKIYGTQEQLAQFGSVWEKAVKQWNTGNFEGAKATFENARQYANQISNATIAKIAVEGNPADSIRALDNALSGLAAAAQGAATGAVGFDKQGTPVAQPKESYYRQTRPLSEGQVYMLFNRVLNEAGFLDKLKAGAAWAGKQATETITSAKLLASWKMSGSPLDSDQLHKFLLDNGVDAGIVDKVYNDMKIQASDSTAASYEEVEKMIAALNTTDKQAMIAYLEKELGNP